MLQAPAFPTTDNSGFLDITDVNSLRMNAVSEVARLQAVEKENAAVKVVNKVEDPQSVPMRRWGLTLIFSAKDGALFQVLLFSL